MRSKTIYVLCALILTSFLINVWMVFTITDIKEQALDIHEHVESLPTDEDASNIDLAITKYVESMNTDIGVTDPVHTGDYQLEIEMDGILMYDEDRYVGFLPFNAKERLHKLILKDNSGR